MSTKEKIKAEITRLKNNFEDEYHPSEYLKKAYADEISKLENKLTQWDADNNVGVKTEEKNMNNKELGTITAVLESGYEIDGDFVVTMCHVPWGSTDLEVGDKVVYWSDEFDVPRCEYYLNYEPEDGEQHPVDAQLREKLGNDVVDKVIDSLPNFAEKSAPEGTGTHLKDALRDQRGRIESEFVVYGFCVLLFLGILISGLAGKYDANPEEAQKQLQEQRDKGIFIKVGETRGEVKYRQIRQNKQLDEILERERCFAFYMIMVRNKYLTVDAAKEALKSGKECGNHLKI